MDLDNPQRRQEEPPCLPDTPGTSDITPGGVTDPRTVTHSYRIPSSLKKTCTPLLVRRSIAKPKDIEYFLVHAPECTTVSEMITTAGVRWRIEDCNAETKDSLGLDEYQVRKWIPWHRHITMCVLAHAFLAVQAAGKARQHQEGMRI